MPNKKLFIAGEGVYKATLEQMTTSKNIHFLGRVSEKKLIDLYKNAKAFIFTPEEDFGISPLEAMASGTPVIAYAKGGALETVIDKKTGIYFHNQNSSDIIKAIKQFEQSRFSAAAIHKHALRFSKKVFQEKFTKYINLCIKKYQQE